ncbi:MAG: pyridoxal-phosphate dependent enzyme, partial [Caldilineaceae bacterium]|nr:pyridoxal-phosphate dependent enzyme [Caldilineaceae bacterium]
MSAIIPGPTYAEMRNPLLLPSDLRAAAKDALNSDELNPANLFNINWKNTGDQVEALVLPKELTGVQANIVVLSGRNFPSGSMKVGPAYVTLAEHEALDGLRPGDKAVIGPSTGNFGIGTAYVSRLKGYQGLVVMPDSMSKERYERIKGYGGELLLTPGTESDVILVLEKVHHELMKDPKNHVLAQFELLPNYRFHRHVSGHAAEVACRGLGDGRVAAYAWAPGSAGSMALADHLKTLYDEFECVALEPEECSTLTNGGRGQHRIEGIGDKMITLIHNALTTDYL